MSNQRFHIFDKLLHLPKIWNYFLFSCIIRIIIISRLAQFIQTSKQFSISSVKQSL